MSMSLHKGMTYAPPTPLRAAFDLSALLKRELDIEIAPERIVELFNEHWHKLSRLAHHIHQPGEHNAQPPSRIAGEGRQSPVG